MSPNSRMEESDEDASDIDADPVGIIEIRGSAAALVRLDAADQGFLDAFESHKNTFFRVLRESYGDYFGDEYHLGRMLNERSIVYFFHVDQLVVAASYVKRNKRRGGTAVYPPEFRRHGLAEAIVRVSFVDFPTQYSIVDVDNAAMSRLLLKVGFRRASSVEQLQRFTGLDFALLSNIATTQDGLTFVRHSDRRAMDRHALALYFREPHDDAG
jgi:hypothetical protein